MTTVDDAISQTAGLTVDETIGLPCW